MLTTELIEHVLATVPHHTVGLLGDLFLDRYLDIDATLNEPSVETGETAYQVTRVRSYPGALGTVLNNLAALGVGRIYPISIIGDDGEGYELRQALDRVPAVVPGGLVIAPNRRTPTYTKPMLMEAGAPPRELNRLDIKNRTPTPSALEDAVLDLLAEAWPQFDALLVLDQVSEADCGVVTTRVRERLAHLAAEWPGKFVLADSRERIGLFRNVCVKPNRDEAYRVFADRDWNTFPMGSARVIHELTNLTNRAVFCTVGEHGIWYARPVQSDDAFDYMDSINHVRTYPVSGPIDVVGAGDSCSAGIACAMVAGATPEQAAAFGNLVASVTIRQIGTTGTASPEQVRQRWSEVQR
jgi:bifunctional ADP-heptose synthase (sugar kinase/adenylyltransferase)